MDARYINVFLDGFARTLEQLGISDIKRSGMKKKDKLYVDPGVSTIVTLRGGVQGNIALSMSQDTARNLASAMMMGMSVTVLDEIAKSAIGELAGMIAGAVSTKMVSLGVVLQISPPIVIFEYADVNLSDTIAIDYETQVGKIEFNIGIN
jgi:chemotaxis protein CheX